MVTREMRNPLDHIVSFIWSLERRLYKSRKYSKESNDSDLIEWYTPRLTWARLLMDCMAISVDLTVAELQRCGRLRSYELDDEMDRESLIDHFRVSLAGVYHCV